jgi:hypothetical protein
MKLNSPREDPYSPKNQVLDNWSDEAFKEEWSIIDENHILSHKEQQYHASDLTVMAVKRLFKQDSFLSDERRKLEPKTMIALKANDGEKGYCLHHWHENQSEVAEAFLQNLEKHDKHQVLFQS